MSEESNLSKPHEPLISALLQREPDYAEALDVLREAVESNDKAWNATTTLREAVVLVGCLRRLVPHATLDEIHRAFGAPGDFGYETVLGEALSRLYRGEP